MISFVWAQDEKGLIGKNGTLPWHLPNDLKFFKEVTLHHTIVMGRKTFDGMEKRLLPNRRTIVLTTDPSYDANGAEVKTVEEVLALAKEQEVYVIGGAQIFEVFMPYVDKLYQTVIHDTFDGDAYMPPFDVSPFTLKEQIEGIVDEKNVYPHTFYIYTK